MKTAFFQNIVSRFCGHEATIGELQSQIARMNDRATIVSGLLTSAVDSGTELERRLQAAERELAARQALIAEQDHERTLLRTAVAIRADEVVSARDQAQVAIGARDLVEQKLSVITEQRDAAHAEMAKLREDNLWLLTSNEKGVERLEAYRSEIAAAKSALSAAHEEAARLNEAIEQLHAQLIPGGAAHSQLRLVEGAEPAPPPAVDDQLISDSTSESVWQLLGIFFIDKRYWILGQDGGKVRISAQMKDPAFREAVHARKHAFADGDYLQVRLQTVSWRRSNGTSYSRYSVLEVIGVIGQAEQLSFVPAEEVTNA